MAKKKAQGLSSGQKKGIGIGLTAAAVAAAGSYFLWGSKNAKKNRETVKSWMLKAKADVLEQLEKAEEMTKGEYDLLVETVGTAYGKVSSSTKAEVAAFKKEMKAHWPEIEKQGKAVVKQIVDQAKTKATKAKTKATKTAKKAAKKVEKKTAAKKSSKKKK